MSKKLLLIICTAILSFGFASLNKKRPNPAITASEFQEHINYLASDELEGRFTGSEGSRLAGVYIKAEFESYGLEPVFEKGFFQEYPFVSDLEITANNSVQFMIGEDARELTLSEDYTPAPFSDRQGWGGELVFAGYGISAPDLEYDDYAGIDVTGKAVLIMRYNPEYDNPHSEFEKYSAFRYKANTAREKGAKAVVFVSGHEPNDPDDKLMKLRYDRAGSVHSLGIVQVKRSVVDDLFASAKLDFAEYQKKITETKTPASFTFDNILVKIETEVKEIEGTGRNVAGLLRGNDPNLRDEFLVMGAHFDHLGHGKTGSLDRSGESLIHNGADDNASGTAGLLELAERFAARQDQLKRSVLFVAFSGEELGLLGSVHLIKNSPISTDNMIAMLNMDMIGRLDEDNKLVVYGAGTSPHWKDLLNELNQSGTFSLTFHDEGYGPSDHSSFYGKEMPVLHFFTGTHPQYHRPSDDADLINSEGAEKVLEYIYQVAEHVNTSEAKPEYVNIPQRDTGRRGFRVYVGTIPDYSENVDGLKISGVSKDGPAEKAGLQGGDIIVSFSGKEITNIYDYTYALQDATPGDVVDVVVLRNGERLTFKVELGAR
jgi:hypothetical protein